MSATALNDVLLYSSVHWFGQLRHSHWRHHYLTQQRQDVVCSWVCPHTCVLQEWIRHSLQMFLQSVAYVKVKNSQFFSLPFSFLVSSSLKHLLTFIKNVISKVVCYFLVCLMSFIRHTYRTVQGPTITVKNFNFLYGRIWFLKMRMIGPTYYLELE